ncbi:MAG: rRNA methyltransferase [Anaerolineaceae bacterium]|nr:rRNA methyltransferase [Anaerolineaceae bacterium]
MSTPVIQIHTKNSEFQYIETLRRNRVKRNQSKEFFVEGVRSIDQALNNSWSINAFVYTREKRLSNWAERILENSKAKKHYELPAHLLKEVSQREDPSELIALVAMPKDELARIPVRENPLIVVLDRPILPGNIGSVIRSCDALRVDGLLITGHSADLYDPETIRATTGSFFSIPTVRLPSHRELIPWIEMMKDRFTELRIVGTSAKATVPIDAFNFRLPTVLLAGNETHGISENYRELCDELTTIPMSGSASSFNLACAVSIMLYEIDRQRRSANV